MMMACGDGRAAFQESNPYMGRRFPLAAHYAGLEVVADVIPASNTHTVTMRRLSGAGDDGAHHNSTPPPLAEFLIP